MGRTLGKKTTQDDEEPTAGPLVSTALSGTQDASAARSGPGPKASWVSHRVTQVWPVTGSEHPTPQVKASVPEDCPPLLTPPPCRRSPAPLTHRPEPQVPTTSSVSFPSLQRLTELGRPVTGILPFTTKRHNEARRPEMGDWWGRGAGSRVAPMPLAVHPPGNSPTPDVQGPVEAPS